MPLTLMLFIQTENLLSLEDLGHGSQSGMSTFTQTEEEPKEAASILSLAVFMTLYIVRSKMFLFDILYAPLMYHGTHVITIIF